MIESFFENNSNERTVSRVFRKLPQFIGPIGKLPVKLRNPHVLHVTILKADPIVSFEYHIRDVADLFRGRVDAVSALGGEEFYSGWCLTYGTSRMFEDAGTILSEEEKAQRLDVPAVVGNSWGLRSKKLHRGSNPYSDIEIAVQQNLGAQLFRLERLIVGILRQSTEGNPANDAQVLLDDHVRRFKNTARSTNQRSQDTDYAFRRLRTQLGPERLRVLYGASTREIGARFEHEGSGFTAPTTLEAGWERGVPELTHELGMLDYLLVLCQRANRMQNFIDRNLDFAGLRRRDDPVALMPEWAAEELMGFGSDEMDRMPDLQELTRIAFHFDYNAADLYPSLGPIGLHLAAACALGRRSRGMAEPETDLELWGLRGLGGNCFEAACFPELRAARHWLRGQRLSELGNGGQLPPFLPPRDGFYNVPIVVKPSGK